MIGAQVHRMLERIVRVQFRPAPRIASPIGKSAVSGNGRSSSAHSTGQHALRSLVTRIALPAACWLAAVSFVMFPAAVWAQERTLDELKQEVQARAERQAYPCEGLKPDEVREALSQLKSSGPDDWASAWSSLGDRYMQKASAEASSPQLADKDFIQAWIYYNFARWPALTSPGKQAAYQKALGAYKAHGRLLHPPLEVVEIPFEGNEITAYVQMPANKKPAPIVVVIPGLDRGKENMAESVRSLLDSGIGYLVLDAPGTGQAPIKARPNAGRMLVQAINYAFQQPDVDKSRVAVYGVSFGGFWASELAVTEEKRLRAVVAQSPPVHDAFQRTRTMEMPKNREFLFDYAQAYMFMFGVSTLTDLADEREAMSLKARGLLDKPAAPMLIIGGALDTQVPVSDIDLLLNSGQTPKEAWINPQGGHMGRDAKGWSNPRIFESVTAPWLSRMLEDRSE
jgi:esterase FrsA